MFVNLTPHAIIVVHPTSPFGRMVKVTIPPSGMVARVAAGAVEGIPDPQEGTMYIVSSALVRAAVPGRSDVASPGELVRDPEGRVIGIPGCPTYSSWM